MATGDPYDEGRLAGSVIANLAGTLPVTAVSLVLKARNIPPARMAPRSTQAAATAVIGRSDRPWRFTRGWPELLPASSFASTNARSRADWNRRSGDFSRQ